MIEKKELTKEKKIDVDNLVSCLECCLLLANQDMSYHLDILKNFYDDDQLSTLGFAHFITSLEVANDMLKVRNAEGKVPLSTSNNFQRWLEQSSMVIHKNLDGFQIRMSSIRFSYISKFAHCFQFRTLKWIHMLDINWISMFSDQPLKSKY